MGILRDLLRHGFDGSAMQRTDQETLPRMSLSELAKLATTRREGADRMSLEKPLTVDSELAHELAQRAEQSYNEKFRAEVKREIERQLSQKK